MLRTISLAMLAPERIGFDLGQNDRPRKRVNYFLKRVPEATMLRSEVTGHRPRAPPHWSVILPRRMFARRMLALCVKGADDFRCRVVCVLLRWRKPEREECEELLLNGKARMHAFDEMRHWRDPVERLRTRRRRRRTLINDNPTSG